VGLLTNLTILAMNNFVITLMNIIILTITGCAGN
jgi:hypothetical protein